MVEQRLVADVDLLPLEHGRHRDHHRELLRVALEVVGHGEHGAVAVAHQRDLRGLVEELRVGLGDVEAAEGAGASGASEGARAASSERRAVERLHAESRPWTWAAPVEAARPLVAGGRATGGRAAGTSGRERRARATRAAVRAEQHELHVAGAERHEQRRRAMRPARESGVVFGSEIMKNAKSRSAPLWSRWSGIASGSPSQSDAAEEERRRRRRGRPGSRRCARARFTTRPPSAGHRGSAKKRRVAPLAGRDPGLRRSSSISATSAKLVGLKTCLPRDAQHELAGDRERPRPATARPASVGAQQQAERQRRDERALGVEAGRVRRAAAAWVASTVARMRRRSRLDVEAQPDDAVDEQAPERGDLIEPGIPSPRRDGGRRSHRRDGGDQRLLDRGDQERHAGLATASPPKFPGGRRQARSAIRSGE